MEEITKRFQQLEVKCENIDQCLSILENYQSNELQKTLQTMNSDVKEVKEMEEEIKQIKDVVKQEYFNCTKRMQNTQAKILFILENIDHLKREPLHEVDTHISINNRESALEAFSAVSTPSMYISEYKNSPFVKKIKPVSLQFLDFKADINDSQFSTVPQYMKCRLTLAELDDFLQNIVIKCFTEKYALLHKKRVAVKPTDLSVWSCYQDQESYFDNEKFITQGDICRLIKRVVDKKIENKLKILRHLHIIKEIRRKSAICYIWVNKSK